MAETETDDAAQEQDPAQEMESGEVSVGQAGQVGYSPSTVEVNRARVQGVGMGQSDLDRQQDPDRERG